MTVEKLEQCWLGMMVPLCVILLSVGYLCGNVVGLLTIPSYLHLAWIGKPRRWDLLIIGSVLGIGHIAGLSVWLGG